MFSMCIDRWSVGKVESKLCSVCVLKKGGSLVQLENKLFCVCVLTEGALVKWRLSYDLYVY